METITAFGYREVVAELLRGVLDTVANEQTLPPQHRMQIRGALACAVMSYKPRDPVEAMLAGQCMVYDKLLRDGALDMIAGRSEPVKIKARPGVLSCGKMFLATLETLERMQVRVPEKLAYAEPVEEAVPQGSDAAPDIAARVPAAAEANKEPRPSQPKAPSSARPVQAGARTAPAAPKPSEPPPETEKPALAHPEPATTAPAAPTRAEPPPETEPPLGAPAQAETGPVDALRAPDGQKSETQPPPSPQAPGKPVIAPPPSSVAASLGLDLADPQIGRKIMEATRQRYAMMAKQEPATPDISPPRAD